MFNTNYRGYDSKKPCPECPKESLGLTLKQEASFFKYWFNCRACGWESRTFRGPSCDGELGVNEDPDIYADKTLNEAKAKTLP
jgi:hypothetical protein